LARDVPHFFADQYNLSVDRHSLGLQPGSLLSILADPLPQDGGFPRNRVAACLEDLHLGLDDFRDGRIVLPCQELRRECDPCSTLALGRQACIERQRGPELPHHELKACTGAGVVELNQYLPGFDLGAFLDHNCLYDAALEMLDRLVLAVGTHYPRRGRRGVQRCRRHPQPTSAEEQDEQPYAEPDSPPRAGMYLGRSQRKDVIGLRHFQDGTHL
jgi:hypothetical protein